MSEPTEEERKSIQEKVDKLKQSKFKQQMLPAWRPVPSFGSTMVIFGVFGVIFMTLGITLYVMSDKIQDAELLYSGQTFTNGAGSNSTCGDVAPAGSTQTCTFTLELSEEFVAPIYVYYQLDNFY